MQKNLPTITCAIFALALTAAADVRLKPTIVTSGGTNGVAQDESQQQKQTEPIWVGDILTSEDTLSYNGYVLVKRQRKVKNDYPPTTRPSWIHVSYATLKRNGIVLANFDDNVYFGMGNSTRFGLFSFLGGPAKQILISQDRFRGGRQWVISAEDKHRIIFVGPDWAVGREGDDMRIIDLDHDGVFEITLPITDFYDFQDKLPIARIPLPEIIFKYDARAMKYLPANLLFESYALRTTTSSGEESGNNEFDHRALILHRLLAYIYAGKQKLAWEFYDKSYNLNDKEDIRRRVKAILARQPVYKFIYNPRRYR